MKFTKFRNLKPHTFKYRLCFLQASTNLVARLAKSCPNDQWALFLIFLLIFLCLHQCIHVFPGWQAQHGFPTTARILLTLWSTCRSSNDSSVEFAFISCQAFSSLWALPPRVCCSTAVANHAGLALPVSCWCCWWCWRWWRWCTSHSPYSNVCPRWT